MISVDHLAEIRDQLNRIESKIDKLEESLYEDDDKETSFDSTYAITDDLISDHDIKTYGERVPYNLIEAGESVTRFRDFIYYVKKNKHEFNNLEYEYAGYSDKTFKDVRISDNTYRILSNAYIKANGKDWDLKVTKGYMYKYQGKIIWEWF